MRALTAFLLLFSLAVLAGAETQSWHKTWSVQGTPNLALQLGDGPIEAAVWNRPEVAVSLTLHRSGWCSLKLSRLRIHTSQAGNQITVSVRTPRMNFALGRCDLSVLVQVPVRANLHLSSGDGHLRVTGVHGALALDTGDGSIEVDSADGGLNASTGDGSIRAAGLFSALHLNTGDGSINLHAAPGSVNQSLWILDTGDGSVRLTLPPGFQSQIDAHTGDGSIHSDFPITVQGSLDRQTLRGTLNGGTAILRIRSGDGSIRLLRG